MKRWCPIALLVCGCTVKVPQRVAGEGLEKSEGQVTLGPTVPNPPGCLPGDLVRATDTGWDCIPAPSDDRDWTDVGGVPAPFADGIDHDTLGGLTCASGQLPIWSELNSRWTCVTPGSTRLQDLYFTSCSASTAGAQQFLPFAQTHQVCDGSNWINLQPQLSGTDVVNLLSTVDGVGSGLDADTLDGIDTAAFLADDGPQDHAGDLTLTGNSRSVNFEGDTISADGLFTIGSEPTPCCASEGTTAEMVGGVNIDGMQLFTVEVAEVNNRTCTNMCRAYDPTRTWCWRAWNAATGTRNWATAGCGASVDPTRDARCNCVKLHP